MGEKTTIPKLRFESRRPSTALQTDDGRAPLPEIGELNTDSHEQQKQAVRRDYTQAAKHLETPTASDEEPALHSSTRLQFDEQRSLSDIDDSGEHSARSSVDDLAESAHERQKRAVRQGQIRAEQREKTAANAKDSVSNGENAAPDAKSGRLHFDDDLPPPSALIQGERIPVAKPPKAGERSTRARRPQSDNPTVSNMTDGPGRLHFEKDRPKKPSALRQTVSITVREAFREQEKNANLDDNAGLDTAKAGERAASSLARSARNHAAQKRAISKSYVLAKSSRESASVTSVAQQAVFRPTERAVNRLTSFVVRSRGKAVLLLLVLMFCFLMNSLSACAPLVQAGLQAVIAGTYPASETDILAAENAYCALEEALADELDNYGMHHPEYTSVQVDRMDIWHDPYVLIALICARFDGGEWTIADAYPYLDQLFHAQYEVSVESNEGIANVTMINKNLSHLPFHVLSHAQVGIYALYMSTLGNMPELFAGNPHASVLKEPMLYNVPEETLAADPNFAALIAEAEKYIGYPYVWGGSEPDTSFDCSGFISWIFTETGVCNIGRLGATGLYNTCEEIQPEEARPGDLIFFSGTLGEGEDGNDGITHVGLYVGDGKMLHCGNPISYAELNRSYWQEHFYGFGRLY